MTDISRLGLPLQPGTTIAMNRESIADANHSHHSRDHRLRDATANKIGNKTISLLILTTLVNRSTFKHVFRRIREENIYKA